jgi:hypothetical protein
MEPLGEVLVWPFLQAGATHLAGIAGVHEQHTPTSFFRFIDAILLELCPSSIENTFVKASFATSSLRKVLACLFILFRLWSPRQIGRRQVLEDERLVGVHQRTGLLVKEVLALIGTLTVHLAHQTSRFLAPLAPFRLRLESLLLHLELLLCTPIMAGIFDGIARREGG